MTSSLSGNSSFFRRALNRGSGRSCRSDAITASMASSGSSAGAGFPATIASIIRSSRSIRSRSAMALSHPCAQGLQRSPLKLFDRTLRAAEGFGDLADAPLLREPLDDDAPLIGRKIVHETKQHRAMLDQLDFVVPRLVLRHRTALARRPDEVIGDLVRRDPIEPRGERRTPPLEPANRGERVAKHLRRQILGDAPIA